MTDYIPENLPPGTTVATLPATLPNGDPVFYNIFWQYESEAYGSGFDSERDIDYFALQDNQLICYKTFEYENIDTDGYLVSLSYYVAIEAFDQSGNYVDSTAFKFRISDVPETLKGTGRGDKLIGSVGQDRIFGLAGRDVLMGDDDNDVLVGGSGPDLLTGGNGSDRFVYKSVRDSTARAPDRITDFWHAEKDVIDLAAIDANTKVSGNQTFKWIGARDFSDKAGELRYEKRIDGTFIYADVNGDGTADMTIRVQEPTKLFMSDFLL